MHFAMMEHILGKLPRQMCIETSCFQKGDLQWDYDRPDGKYVSNHCKKLKQYMLSQDNEHKLLFDLMEKLLEYEPLKRITARKVLRHLFFTRGHRQGQPVRIVSFV